MIDNATNATKSFLKEQNVSHNLSLLVKTRNQNVYEHGLVHHVQNQKHIQLITQNQCKTLFKERLFHDYRKSILRLLSQS